VIIINTFAERLKIALDNKGMKSSVLAYRINVHRSYVSNWLSGKYKANSEKQLEIAKILGVSPAWLAGHDVPMQEETEKSSASAELSEQVVIYHRDGKNIVKKFSPEQIKAIHAFLEAMPAVSTEEEKE
jgi:transcriptional regulator with XRE-family HTH domain